MRGDRTRDQSIKSRTLYQTELARPSSKKVLPGLEPGLQGSKPWVLTNYTIEPTEQKVEEQGIDPCSVASRPLCDRPQTDQP